MLKFWFWKIYAIFYNIYMLGRHPIYTLSTNLAEFQQNLHEFKEVLNGLMVSQGV